MMTYFRWPWSHGRLNWLAPCKPQIDDTLKTVRAGGLDVNLDDFPDQAPRSLRVHRLQIR